MKTFQLFSVSRRSSGPQLSSPASPFTTAVCLITPISITALSIGLSPSLASDFGGNCLQRRLTNREPRLRSGPHTHLPNLIDFLPSQFLQSKPSEAPPLLPVCLSGGSTQILTHTHTRTLQNKVERLASTTPRSLHLSAPPPPPFLSFSASSLLGFVASKLGQLGFLRFQLVLVQPTLAQLRKAGMSRTGTFRVNALTRRLRSSVRRTTSLWSLTVPSVGMQQSRNGKRHLETCEAPEDVTYFSHWA